MNSKRQTIWLVSMLSLMVVLSAYYLFTEDVSKLKTAADPTQAEQTQVSTQETNPVGMDAGEASADKSASGLTDTGSAGKADSGKSAADAGKSDAGQPAAGADQPVSAQEHSDASAAAKDAAGDKAKSTDAEILDKVASQGTSEADFFAYNLMQQTDQMNAKLSKLTDKMADAKLSFEEQSQAQEQYDAIEKQQAMITSIQEQLQKDGYTDSLVQEDSGKWRIIVQSGKLEKSQAVSIVDLAADVLNVGPEKIVIQYHK